MIRRLIEAHFFAHRQIAAPALVQFWFRELRTPELLVELGRDHPRLCRGLARARPALTAARAGQEVALANALREEEADAEPAGMRKPKYVGPRSVRGLRGARRVRFPSVSGALFSCGSPGSGTMLPSSCLRIRRQGSRRRTPAAGGARPSSTREPRGRCPSARHDPREDRIRGLAREGLAERRTNIMNIPRFTGEASLYPSTSSYRSRGYSRHGQSADSHAHTVVPAIPYCGNCDWILDNCERNGWRPRAVCNACLRGYCYDAPPPGQTS